MFHIEWMEVEVPYKYCFEKRISRQNEDNNGTNENEKLNQQVPIDCPNDRCKVVYVDVDVGKKSDRQEWGHVKYQSIYKPDEAFELSLQWMQASGAIVADLVILLQN